MYSIALIGCGLIGREHARCLAELGSPPVLFADPNVGRAQELARTFGGSATDQPMDAIGSDVDAVYICTYHDTHAPLAIAAARAGKHIFLEKPMALRATECQAICEAASQNGVRLMTGFKFHYYSLTRTARRLLGTPLVLSAHVIDRRWPDDSWANDPVRGGGNVLSQGCHGLELLWYFANSRPIRIFAEGGNLHHPGLDLIDTLSATIAFDNGAVASLLITDTGEMPHDGKFTIQAMNGNKTIHLYDRLTKLSYFDGQTEARYSSEEDGFINENREFLAALAGNRNPETDGTDGMRATLVLLAGIESVKTHSPQSLEHIG